MTTATHIPEPIITMPTRRLLAAIGVAGAASVAAWAAVAWIADGGADAIIAGAAGGAVATATGVLGVLLTRPWRPREITAWTTMWLGMMVVRLLLTPLLGYLLYSATPLSLTPLMLSVAVTYVIVLFSETAVLAVHVRRVT